MEIITVSREFGSGGRELGKRLADIMNFDYFDKEIIAAISSNKGLDEKYVEKSLESNYVQTFSYTFGNTFGVIPMLQAQKTELFLEQKRVIEEIAKLGKNCVIVGRNADVILKEYNPFNIFVCADMEAKIRRCLMRAPKGENLTRKKIIQNIKNIDKSRARIREFMTDSKWGSSSTYHLTVNTTDWDIKELAQAVSEFAASWFKRKKSN